MVQRCTNPKNSAYATHGGRGIAVCERWRTFANFLTDMGERPDGLTIERIDNDRGYEPGNCRWATRKEQANNRRTSVLIEFRGESKCLSEWARAIGISPQSMQKRLRLGWPLDEALTVPRGVYVGRRKAA